MTGSASMTAVRSVDDAAGIRRTRLDSGLRVVTEHLPGLRSAAVGFWVGTGSRDEAESVAGASHFLEHLLFKGTDDAPRAGDRGSGRVVSAAT